jgi:peptide/nickel transport system permease protein
MRAAFTHRSATIAPLALGAVCALLLIFPPAAPSPTLEPLAAPSWKAFLGSDVAGRDVLRITIAGLLNSIANAGFVTVLSLIVGIAFALVSALRPGKIADQLILHAAELCRAFPAIILALLLFRAGFSLTILLVVVFWPAPWRLARNVLIANQSQAYALNAELMGRSRLGVLGIEVMPNVWPHMLVYCPILFAEAIAAQAGLEFLGFASSLEAPTLGRLLFDAFSFGLAAPWIWLPSLGALTILAWLIVVLRRGLSKKHAWSPIV